MIGDCWTINYSGNIVPIKIIKETEKTILVERIRSYDNRVCQERRMKRAVPLFATWDEAKAYVVKRAEDSLEGAKRRVDQARSALEVAKALKQ